MRNYITQGVGTEVTFCMAHCLKGLEGLKTERCRSVHGHNYKLRLKFELTPQENGLCFFDFSDLKKIATTITDPWDHAMAVCWGDQMSDGFVRLREGCTSVPGLCFALVEPEIEGSRGVHTTWQVTAENLARHFVLAALYELERVQRLKGVENIQVALWETDKSFATATLTPE